MTKHNSSGFTLIEMVVALTCASMLMAGLAGAMLVTNRSLEDAASPETRQAVIRQVADRIAEDMHHATTIDFTGQSLSIGTPDRDGDGIPEVIVYSGTNAGLVRSQATHPAIALLSTAPTINFRVDEVIAPTIDIPPTDIKLQAWTQMATTSPTWFTSVEVPGSCRTGDLLVLVTLGNDSYVMPWGGSWTAADYHGVDDLYLSIFTRTATSSESGSQSLFATDPTSLAATVLCFSGEGRTMFDDNFIQSSGYANVVTNSNLPIAAQLATIPNHAGNLQVFAFDGNPLRSQSAGIPGFSSVSIATATSGGTNRLTLVTAVRNGRYSQATTATVALATSTDWSSIATQWWP